VVGGLVLGFSDLVPDLVVFGLVWLNVTCKSNVGARQ
jgi:hypothetical protein